MRGQEFQAPEAVWVFILDLCGNLNFRARISVYRQWIAKLKQFIGMIREAYYDHVTKIRLSSAERAGDRGAKTFRHPDSSAGADDSYRLSLNRVQSLPFAQTERFVVLSAKIWE
jgi:hypothetical protein